MVRTLGIVYPELISWIEANVVSNNKVLYVPNEKSGILSEHLKWRFAGDTEP
jgi:hypothetical protein